MSLNSRIVDGSGKHLIAKVHQRDSVNGLVVYTEPLKVMKTSFIPAFNSNEGIEMAKDGSFGGTPVVVHTGTSDGTNWTGTNVIGTKADFNSSAQANNGTVSVLINNPQVNDVWQFDKGSDIVLSSYSAITMFVYVDKDWSVGESVGIYGWDTATALQIGDQVLLENYINEFDFNVWQKVTIPLTDMNLEAATIDAIRMEMLGAGSGPNPKFYIDDMQVEETGTPILFKVSAAAGQKYIVSKFNFTIIDAHAGTLLNNSMPSISYDKLLGETLSNGISFVLEQNGELIFSANIKSVGDSIKGGGEVINMISDGTNTSITMSTDFLEPIVLDSRDSDFIGVTIADDLTGLISLTAIALGRTEEI